jgi:hypothetical protein
MKTNKNKTAVEISHKMELVGFLRSIGAECRFITLTTETEVKMVKKHRTTKEPNPFLGTVKVARRNGLVNIDYVAAVERNMEKAGIENAEYVAGTTWYMHEQTTDGKAIALCRHKTKEAFYLQYFPMRNLETRYVLNGKDLTPEQVTAMKEYLSEQSENEFKPRVITLAMDSIRSVTFRKVEMLNNTFSRLVNHLARLKSEMAVEVNENLDELAVTLENELGPVGEFVEGE